MHYLAFKADRLPPQSAFTTLLRIPQLTGRTISKSGWVRVSTSTSRSRSDLASSGSSEFLDLEKNADA